MGEMFAAWVEMPEGVRPGDGLDQPLQAWGHFGLRIPGAVILGSYAVPISCYHSMELAVD